ncbi:hypothetical protein [Streptomyces albidocamelliae]|uniref:Uncharacterized protein n=1 Tax=Streptomyces albidocamelliae TaxID=2981135 RepID=A0ABY6EWX8_9ACTN|nr:hypothetical protein [Streptomyces sp. HUAS 14-6]UXY38919.1 hypothetical protein N8I86_31875 [Streptomyces sp. HUAS 14-6]
MFRSLGLMAGTGRSIAAAAAGAGLDEFRTADLLGLAQLVHLLRDTEHGRPTWHDLVHEFARERVLGEESETERLAALDRILDHYPQRSARSLRGLRNVPVPGRQRGPGVNVLALRAGLGPRGQVEERRLLPHQLQECR